MARAKVEGKALESASSGILCPALFIVLAYIRKVPL